MSFSVEYDSASGVIYGTKTPPENPLTYNISGRAILIINADIYDVSNQIVDVTQTPPSLTDAPADDSSSAPDSPP